MESVEIARDQQARFWELRTSCDLAELWQRQGQSRKAFTLLRPVYDQFTEGFDTVDLRNAQALLRQLNEGGWKLEKSAHHAVKDDTRRRPDISAQ